MTASELVTLERFSGVMAGAAADADPEVSAPEEIKMLEHSEQA